MPSELWSRPFFRFRRQYVAVLAIGSVATVLTMLSLSHLAIDIAIVTGAGLAEA